MAVFYWWGLRAFQAAQIGARCVRLRRSSDNAERDFVTVTGGGVDIVAITAFAGGSNLFVSAWYDQTRNANNADLTQATAGNQPAFTLSGIGSSLPCLTFASTNNLHTATSAGSAQPYTISVVFNDSGSPSSGVLIQSSNSLGIFCNDGVANTIEIYAGTQNQVSATNGNWFAFQGVGNGASSDANLNGTVHTASAGAGTMTGGNDVGLTNGTFSFIGKIVEGGTWGALAFSSSQSSQMATNQRAYWGF